MAKGKTEPDVVGYITHAELEIVKKRIPGEFRTRLRDIFIWCESYGVRTLGYVTRAGRRDVNLSAFLPYRVSLRQFLVKGQSALEFGTAARGQWTPWAVRRFLLYDVFLHEIGHLQLIDDKKSNTKRKYASETLAQKFADELRRKLWSSYFEHPDPVHNRPQPDELSIIPLWQNLDKKQRFKLVDFAVRAPHKQVPDLSDFGELDENQQQFLMRALCFHAN
jgi:hypothetical protein